MDFDLSTYKGCMAKVEFDLQMMRAARQLREKEEAKKQREIIVNMNSDKIAKAEADIAFWNERAGDLYALLSVTENNLAAAPKDSRDQIKLFEKTISLKNKIHAAEIRLAKAKADKENAVEVIMP